MMAATIKLRGITWNHSRGYLPLVATAQRFSEIHPPVEIAWEKRSLQEFADFPIEKLAERFDLLIIDHPFAGYAANHQVLLSLDEFLPQDFLAGQASHSVGKSHESYLFDGHQWALAIDAAAPVSARRQDVLDRAGLAAPENWAELVALAKQGLVVFPAIPVDSLMNFYMLCASQGEEPFSQEERIISRDMGLQALHQLAELARLCPPEIFSWNPIAVYEALASRDDLAYCPFAFGYANYARPGYAQKRLEFGDIVRINGREHGRSTLGGTGLAIAAGCAHTEMALEYAQYVASPNCQRTLYFQSGGQPGHRSAWLDAEVNRASHNYFKHTLAVLDRAYLRPRYDGYIHFQDQAGVLVHEFLRQGGDGETTLKRMQQLYEQSRNNL